MWGAGGGGGRGDSPSAAVAAVRSRRGRRRLAGAAAAAGRRQCVGRPRRRRPAGEESARQAGGTANRRAAGEISPADLRRGRSGETGASTPAGRPGSPAWGAAADAGAAVTRLGMFCRVQRDGQSPSAAGERGTGGAARAEQHDQHPISREVLSCRTKSAVGLGGEPERCHQEREADQAPAGAEQANHSWRVPKDPKNGARHGRNFIYFGGQSSGWRDTWGRVAGTPPRASPPSVPTFDGLIIHPPVSVSNNAIPSHYHRIIFGSFCSSVHVAAECRLDQWKRSTGIWGAWGG